MMQLEVGGGAQQSQDTQLPDLTRPFCLIKKVLYALSAPGKQGGLGSLGEHLGSEISETKLFKFFFFC